MRCIFYFYHRIWPTKYLVSSPAIALIQPWLRIQSCVSFRPDFIAGWRPWGEAAVIANKPSQQGEKIRRCRRRRRRAKMISFTDESATTAAAASSAWAADGKVMRRLALLHGGCSGEDGGVRLGRAVARRWFILRLMSNEARCSDWLEATFLRRVYTQTTPQSNCTATKATSTSQTVISLIGTSTAFLCGSPLSPAADVFLLFCYSVRTMLKWNYYFAWVLWVR